MGLMEKDQLLVQWREAGRPLRETEIPDSVLDGCRDYYDRLEAVKGYLERIFPMTKIKLIAVQSIMNIGR